MKSGVIARSPSRSVGGLPPRSKAPSAVLSPSRASWVSSKVAPSPSSTVPTLSAARLAVPRVRPPETPLRSSSANMLTNMLALVSHRQAEEEQGAALTQMAALKGRREEVAAERHRLEVRMRQRLAAVETRIDELAAAKGNIMWKLQQHIQQQQNGGQESGDVGIEELQSQLADVEGQANKLLEACGVDGAWTRVQQHEKQLISKLEALIEQLDGQISALSARAKSREEASIVAEKIAIKLQTVSGSNHHVSSTDQRFHRGGSYSQLAASRRSSLGGVATCGCSPSSSKRPSATGGIQDKALYLNIDAEEKVQQPSTDGLLNLTMSQNHMTHPGGDLWPPSPVMKLGRLHLGSHQILSSSLGDTEEPAAASDGTQQAPCSASPRILGRLHLSSHRILTTSLVKDGLLHSIPASLGPTTGYDGSYSSATAAAWPDCYSSSPLKGAFRGRDFDQHLNTGRSPYVDDGDDVGIQLLRSSDQTSPRGRASS